MLKPDWNAIKSEYITTDISYRKLAEKWAVSFRTLAERAKREDWTGGRDKHCNKIVAQTVQKVANKTASDYAHKLIRLQTAADSMSEVIADIFQDTEQFKRHIIQTRDGDVWDVDCRTMDKIDAKAIKDITGALKDLALVMRNLYGLPTVQEQSAMDIAAKRLTLEEQKAGANTGDDDNTGLVEIATVLEEAEDA